MPVTLFNYIGTFLVGGTVALLLYAVARTFKLKLAGWVYPAAIGISMIAFQIYNDYTWFGRTAAALPPSHVVTGSFVSTSPLKVWSYAVPIVDRFSVVDRGSVKRNPATPGLVIADVFLVTRFQPTIRAVQFFDCTAGRRADAHQNVTFDEDGKPENLEWVPLEPGDPMLEAACSEEPVPGVPTS